MPRIYHVTVRPDGQWQGGQKQAKLPLFLASTQREVEEMMCEVATDMGDAHVLIFNARGVLLRDRVFGPAPKVPQHLPVGTQRN